jgi:SNF2 family DNA or RNA helicase
MKAQIDFDKATSRFILSTPMWMLDAVRGIPNRRFNQSRKVWTAPAIRMNVAYLREKFPYSQAEWTPAAKQIAEDVTRPPKIEAIPFPAGYVFKTKPMEHQNRALNKAWSQKNFGLFMEPGTGKTKTTIDLMTARFLAGEIDTVIVVCPNDVKGNWPTQITMHSPVGVNVFTLDMDKKDPWTRHAASHHSPKDGLCWYIIGIESIQGSVRAFEQTKLFANGRAAMVVDESSRIKSPSAVRAKRCCDIGVRCTSRLILTGTEITQGIIDLFMQFEFLDPQIIGIGDWYSFRNRFAVMGGFENKQIIGYQNVDELMEIIRPHVFEVSKAEALPDLPPKVYETRIVKPNEEQKRIYRDLNKYLEAEINGQLVEPKNVLEKMLRLQEVTSGFYSVEEMDPITEKKVFKKFPIPGTDPKISALLDLSEEIRGKAIIWSRFRWQIEIIASALRKKYGDESVVEFHGGIDSDARIVARQKFQDVSSPVRWFVGNQATGGIGIDLFAANTMIYLANDFSSEKRIQSEDRAHRIGQREKVLYIDLVMEGTVDRVIMAALKQKKDMMDFVKQALREGTKEVLTH